MYKELKLFDDHKVLIYEQYNQKYIQEIIDDVKLLINLLDYKYDVMSEGNNDEFLSGLLYSFKHKKLSCEFRIDSNSNVLTSIHTSLYDDSYNEKEKFTAHSTIFFVEAISKLKSLI